MSKLEGDYAVTTLEFSIDETVSYDIPIPKGTEVETEDGNYTFATEEDATITAGTLSVDVAATCETLGEGANGYEAGTVNNLLTTLTYNVDNAENISVTSGGADEESKDSLRERIRLAPESFSNAGSEGAYRFHTLSAHQSITDVEVISSEAGVVDIYPLTSDGNPTEEMIQVISDYLSADNIRPLTDKVVVHTPEKIDFNIIANITLYADADSSSVESLINESLTAYKADMASELGKDIVPTQIIAILNSIYGVYKVELLSPAYQVLEKSQWANLANFSITIDGRADE